MHCLRDRGNVSARAPMGASMLALATPRLALLGLVGSLTLGLAARSNETVSSPTSPTLLPPSASPIPPLQPSPDLVVAAPPSVSNSSPTADTPFTLSVTVRNAGDGDAAGTLRYYRSTDATITPSDTPVGTGTVVRLAGSGTVSESVELMAPSTPGTYYYGACVDAVTGESNTTNNCSGSVPEHRAAVCRPTEEDIVAVASAAQSTPLVQPG